MLCRRWHPKLYGSRKAPRRSLHQNRKLLTRGTTQTLHWLTRRSRGQAGENSAPTGRRRLRLTAKREELSDRLRHLTASVSRVRAVGDQIRSQPDAYGRTFGHCPLAPAASPTNPVTTVGPGEPTASKARQELPLHVRFSNTHFALSSTRSTLQFHQSSHAQRGAILQLERLLFPRSI